MTPIHLLLPLFLPIPIHATPHNIPFPSECCRGSDVGGDCHAIPASDLRLLPDGSYLILATRERFVSPTSPSPPLKPYRWSTDGSYYRCNQDPSDPSSLTYCLFIPPPGV